jgi:putative hemolysin
MMVNVSEEEGVLEEGEREMIHSIFELGDRPVRDIMVPRIDMITLESKDTLEEAITLIMQGGQSRIPVYEETIDNIIGVLYAKDLLRHARQGNLQAKVRDFVRPAYFVPESKKLDDLLHELQQQRIHIAIIVDEYGAVAGLVTIEDLVEQIIGDIQDEYDKEEILYEKVSDNEYIIDAKIGIDEFNELLNTRLTDEDYDTLGGFVYTQLDKVPSVGDEVTYQDLTLTVLSTKGRRITKVKVVRHPHDPQPEDEHEHDGGKNHQRQSELAAQREHQERASTGAHRSA